MLEELLKRPIIPVIVIDDPEAAVPLAGALLEGGIDVIEITFRTAAAAESITRIRTALPDMLVGAGTVLTAEQADRAIDAGAGFGLAPGFNSEVVVHFNGRGGHFIPGVMTPSDIERALDVDCTLMKFFPAGPAGGIPMLQALAGPYAGHGVRFCPTGGITPANMADYLALDIVFAVGGSWLATKEQIADRDWSSITRQARDAVSRCL